jgi:hypothetical protein
MMENFELFGVELHELDASQREAFASVARGMHADYAAGVEGGSDILKKIQAGIAAAPK